MRKILDLTALDIRAPTSRTLAGSDAVHGDPDYSAAYVILRGIYIFVLRVCEEFRQDYLEMLDTHFLHPL